jgi:hypothetical protein
MVSSSAEISRAMVQQQPQRHPSLQQQRVRSPLPPKKESLPLRARGLLPPRSKSRKRVRLALALVQKISLDAPKEKQRRRKQRRKLKRQRERSQMVSRLLKSLKSSLRSLVLLLVRMAMRTTLVETWASRKAPMAVSQLVGLMALMLPPTEK